MICLRRTFKFFQQIWSENLNEIIFYLCYLVCWSYIFEANPNSCLINLSTLKNEQSRKRKKETLYLSEQF